LTPGIVEDYFRLAAALPNVNATFITGCPWGASAELEPLYDRARQRRRRTGPLREIVLARALYRCGDHEQLGERILKEYSRDIRGLFARHAAAVLAEKPDHG
jgi:hypothetical protein